MSVKDRIAAFVRDREVAFRSDIHRQMKDEGVKRGTVTQKLWELVDEGELDRDEYRYWPTDAPPPQVEADGDDDAEDPGCWEFV